MAVVICPEHYKTLNHQGWDKARVQKFLSEHAVRSLSDLKKVCYTEQPVNSGDEEILVW